MYIRYWFLEHEILTWIRVSNASLWQVFSSKICWDGRLASSLCVIHHVRNNSPEQGCILQTVFCCCGRGQTCWQSREGPPGGLFCPLKYLILSYILSLWKQYHVLTLSHWNGNTGLRSHCIARAPKVLWSSSPMLTSTLCYLLSSVSKCIFLSFLLAELGSSKSQVFRSLNISAFLVSLLLEHPLLTRNQKPVLKESQPTEREAAGKNIFSQFLLVFFLPSVRYSMHRVIPILGYHFCV